MTVENLKTKLEGLLRCPVDWAGVTGISDAHFEWLLFDWYRCLKDTAVSVDEEEAAISDINWPAVRSMQFVLGYFLAGSDKLGSHNT